MNRDELIAALNSMALNRASVIERGVWLSTNADAILAALESRPTEERIKEAMIDEADNAGAFDPGEAVVSIHDATNVALRFATDTTPSRAPHPREAELDLEPQPPEGNREATRSAQLASVSVERTNLFGPVAPGVPVRPDEHAASPDQCGQTRYTGDAPLQQDSCATKSSPSRDEEGSAREAAHAIRSLWYGISLPANAPSFEDMAKAALKTSIPETQTAEGGGQTDPLHRAREAFLNLIADADKWEEEVDGDADDYGRPVMTVDYVIHTGHTPLAELVDALGIPGSRYMETLKDRIDRAVQA